MILTETPSPGRVERRKEETRQKIIRVAMDLFRRHGYSPTTMERIAEEADIAKGTLYHYFPVKEAILNEYIKQTFRERNSERIQRLRQLPDTRARMVLVLSELMEGVQAQRELFEIYFTYRIQNMIALNVSESEESGFRAVGVEIIRLGQDSGEIRSDLTLDFLEALFEFVFIEVAQQFYKDPEKFVAREVIEQFVDLFMNGARQPSHVNESNEAGRTSL